MPKRYRLILISIILIAGIGVCQLLYSEQVQRDMYAAVVVLPTFKLLLDNANIDFGFVMPGQTVELNPYSHYNQVTSISNKGMIWYLKISVMGEVACPPESDVPLDSFQWMAESSSGDGTIEPGWHPLTRTPALVYTSGQRDMSGKGVLVRFKYRFALPQSAKGGRYGLNVIYTMTDVP